MNKAENRAFFGWGPMLAFAGSSAPSNRFGRPLLPIDKKNAAGFCRTPANFESKRTEIHQACLKISTSLLTILRLAF